MVFVVLTNPLLSQEEWLPGFDIYNFSVEEGLSQSTVFAIFQDSKGFMWFGTRGGGLNRYDGYDFTVYKNKLTDSTSISNNEVTTIYEDSNGQLWIGTRFSGINKYRRDDESFIRYSAGEGKNRKISDNSINVICESKNGNLWVGTDEGLNLYQSGEDHFKEIRYKEESIKEITSIAEDPSGRIILGTRHFILIVGPDQSEMTVIPHDSVVYSFTTAGGQWFATVYVDRRHNIWVGTPGGLYLLNLEGAGGLKANPLEIDFLTRREIRTINEDRRGNLWFGTPNGLLLVNPQNNQHTLFAYNENENHGLKHNSIYSVFEDRVGNIWAGTWGGGVSMISHLPKKFRHYYHIPHEDALSDNIVSSFHEDNEGLWVGTEMGGLNYYDPGQNKFTIYLPNPDNKYSLSHTHIKCLYRDSRKDLWIGTFGGGLNLYRKKENKFYHFLPGQKVYSIIENPAGVLWVGCISGLYRMDLATGTFKKYRYRENIPGTLRNSFVTSLFIDSRDNLWVGTKGGGLNLYNKPSDNFVVYQHDDRDTLSLSDDYVICMTQDIYGTLWIGTNNGLCSFDYEMGKFRRYDIDIGLPDNVINGIVPDAEGNLWISTNKGLSRFSPVGYKVRNYTFRDGLQSNEFNRGAFYKSNTGEIFFGGINGYNCFHPNNVKDNEKKPDIIFTEFRLFQNPVKPGVRNSPLKKHISETEHITLNYRQSVMTFDFVALNYIIPEKNMYRYRLEGYDNDWVDLGTGRRVTFMNLPDGDYVLRVIASNNDEVWNTEGISLKLTILPPPWRTRWAYSLYLMLIMGLILFWYRLMASRMEQKNILLNERLEKERNEELNQMKLRFFTSISHEFRTPLTLISAPLDHLLAEEIPLERKKYYYKIIKDNVRRLKRLVDQLMDFRKAEHERLRLKVRPSSMKTFIDELAAGFNELAERKEIDFSIDCNGLDTEVQWFDPGILDKVIFNLLSNAFKFTPQCGSVKLEVRPKDEDNVLIRVCDTGVGISPEELPYIFERFSNKTAPDKKYFSGTGIGLEFSRKLIEIHRGNIFAESDKGKGTVFTVEVPVNRQAYSTDEVIEDHPIISLEDESEEYADDTGHIGIPPCEETEGKPLMLLVEDNEDLNNYLKNQFQNSFRVMVATNGAEGFSLAREHLPDIIISDIIMKVMDGYELCRKIREDIITNHIPLVLLTALSSIDNKTEGIELGADAYIEKPFETKYLESVVNNLLAQRAMLKEKFLLESRSLASFAENPSEARFLEKVDQIVKNNLSDPNFSVSILGNELNMSRSQLFRKFRSMTGKSPRAFIQIMRLKNAAEIMLREGINVNEVTYEVGFTSPSHFISSFKKYFGKTPKEYVSARKT